jgi:hypothetical protein
MHEPQIRIRKKPIVCFSEEFSRGFCPAGLKVRGELNHGKAFFVLGSKCGEITGREVGLIRFKGNGPHRTWFVKEVLRIVQEVCIMARLCSC